MCVDQCVAHVCNDCSPTLPFAPTHIQVRDFQSVIGKETRQQCLEKWGGKPDIIMACVGGGSNAMGIFHEFVEDREIRLIGVEAGGEGVNTSKHAATLTKGTPGVLHGSYSYLLQVCVEGAWILAKWVPGS